MNSWTKINFINTLLTSSREDCSNVLSIVMKGGNFMTSMQVEYSKLKEAQRHNLATEQQQVAELEETKSYHAGQLYLSGKQLDESIRHNITSETEIMRNHLVSEAEIARHNRISEDLQRAQNETNRYVAELKAATNVKTTQMRNMSAEEQTLWTNSVKQTIADQDRAQEKTIAEANRMVDWYRAMTSDAKVQKEIEKLQLEIDNYSSYVSNEGKKANAAFDSAQAALLQAQNAKDRNEEEKYLHDWQMQLDKWYADIYLANAKQDSWSQALADVNSTLTTVVNALKPGQSKSTTKSGSSKNTLGEVVANSSRTKTK